MKPTSVEDAERIFRERGGTLRTREAIAAEIHPRTLYRMRDPLVPSVLTSLLGINTNLPW